ncbi:MAG: hypothetical protein GY772_12755, partial [bacterium]|nr:hypothetical protein [bacterium]
MLQPSVFAGHELSQRHLAARDAVVQARSEAKPPNTAQAFGEMTGASNLVPRLDTFVTALAGVATYNSFSSAGATKRASQVGAALSGDGDASTRVLRQCTLCLAEPLHLRNQDMLRHSRRIAIAFDERQGVVLVFARILADIGGRPFVHECLLGLARDFGTGTENVCEALKEVFRRACAVRRGRRPGQEDSMGPEDYVDEALLQHARERVEVAVADGGPSEQRALYALSPSPPPGGQAPPAGGEAPGEAALFFPNLNFITRDRAHRLRSVQRGAWDHMADYVKDFLNTLVTGEGSLARVLSHSRKLSLFWEEAQRERNREGALDTFARVVRNVHYAEQRFDSRSAPLFTIFSMLPTVIRFLQICAKKGDRADHTWAENLLRQLAGDTGYDRLVSAAVFSDAMIESQLFLRVCDQDEDDVTVTGAQASQILRRLRFLLLEGGIWLPEAEQTLTHKVLQAIGQEGVVTFWKAGGRELTAVPLGWPDPASLHRLAPVERAKEAYQLFESFFNANFPNFEETNAFAALDVSQDMPLSERRALFQTLARRRGLDADRAWTQLVGASDTGAAGGLLGRALWHRSPTGLALAAEARPPTTGRAERHPRDPDGNAAAWLRTLRELRPASRQLRAEACELVEVSIVFLTKTCNVERWLMRIQLIEMKRRMNKLSLACLESSARLLLQDLRGRRVEPLDAVRLLTQEGRYGGGPPTLWAASRYCLRAQNVYREWYGDRAAPSRELLCQTFGDRLRRRREAAKPPLGTLRQRSARSKAVRLKAHTESVS